MRKRIACFISAVVFLCATLMGRIGYIVFGGEYTVSQGYNSYSLTACEIPTTLYYSDMGKINNNKTVYLAVIRPNEKCIGELYSLFDYQKRNEIIEKLKKGYPIIEKLDTDDTPPSLKYIKIIKATEEKSTDMQMINKESSGLLYYVKNKNGKIKVNFSVDARGRLLDGDEGTVIYDDYSTTSGLKLTINKKIQAIAQNSAKSINNGCVIIMNTEDSSILACVNKPSDSYVNKALSQYAVGSIFKLVVAACAIENNVFLQYNCNGKIKVGDTEFSCQGKKAHKNQGLKDALANSCNCYFVNLALTLGQDKLLKTANEFGFADNTTLYGDWNIKNASLPNKSNLALKGQLALFGFGQGKFTASPLQMCNVLCTIANGGTYNKTKLVSSIVDDRKKQTEIKYQKEKRILTKSQAKRLIGYMRYVVTDGTGANAETYRHKSAGKTATAQTGQYNFGIEKLNTWFAGVYPYDNPKYAIVIMTENGISGSSDCCPVFRTIVENLDNM